MDQPKVITLQEIPPPPFDGTIAIKVDKETYYKVLERCEELGWKWASGRKATEGPAGCEVVASFSDRWLCLGCSEHKISDLYVLQTRDLEKGCMKPYIVFFSKSICTVDLKAANTNPSATNCASCGHQLKNPVPGWDRMKYCPKCEA
jgi:hypothetical protein